VRAQIHRVHDCGARLTGTDPFRCACIGSRKRCAFAPCAKPVCWRSTRDTTSTRAILFDDQARPVKSHAIPLRQIYPANGWVEHDPREIWQAALDCCRAVLKGEEVDGVAAIGITNQARHP
jgi:hypothetical protein